MLFQLELYESQFNYIAIRNTDCPVTSVQTSIVGAVPAVVVAVVVVVVVAVEVVVVVVVEVVEVVAYGENIT